MTEPPGSPAPDSAPTARARPRRLVLLVAVMLGLALLVLGGCAAILVLGLNAASDAIDPARNAQTGLADGSYVLRSTSSVVINDECSFTGQAFETQSEALAGDQVTVVGAGRDCAYRNRTSLVAFEVVAGTARITQVR